MFKIYPEIKDYFKYFIEKCGILDFRFRIRIWDPDPKLFKNTGS
jgi:hypothetical protein